MKSNAAPHTKRSDANQAAVDEVLDRCYRLAKAQFGDVVKFFWLYDGGLCPGCAEHSIGAVGLKGKDELSVNAFIYRERGVLIAYLLCESCARFIFNEARKNPYHETSKHTHIERTLIAAYHKHLASLDA
jgi:hypothetical protein